MEIDVKAHEQLQDMTAVSQALVQQFKYEQHQEEQKKIRKKQLTKNQRRQLAKIRLAAIAKQRNDAPNARRRKNHVERMIRQTRIVKRREARKQNIKPVFESDASAAA